MCGIVCYSALGTLTLLLLLLDCASLAVSQLCSPSYGERVNPLMDTYTIPLLLPTGNHDGPWQSLDLDDNNQEGQQTMWSLGGLSCLNKLYVCGFHLGPQNNWLITQHISRQVEIGETTLESVEVTFGIVFSSDCASNPSCIEALSLYVWETSTSNDTSAADTSNYRFVENVTADFLELTLTFMSQHSGFYLGIRDNGTCLGGMNGAALSRVLVSYKSCPSDTLGLVSVTEVIAGTENVLGLCVGNSSAVQGGGALLSCSDNGEWRVLSGCECDPGYWLSEETQKCVVTVGGNGENKKSNNTVVIGVSIAIVVVVILLLIVAGVLLIAYSVKYSIRLGKSGKDATHIYDTPDVKPAPPLPPRAQQNVVNDTTSQHDLNTAINTIYDTQPEQSFHFTENTAYDT